MPNRDPWREAPDPLGTRFVLPPRSLPWLRGVGIGIIAGGIAFDAVFLGVTGPMWWPVLRDLASGGPVGPDAALLAIPLVIGCGMVVPMWLGSLVGFGHAELLLTSAHAVGIDRAGPFRYRRRIALSEIARLTIDLNPVEINDRPVRSGPWGDVGALSAKRSAGDPKPTPLVIGYPRDVLAELADAFRERAGLHGAAGPIEITTRSEHAEQDAEGDEIVPDQPRKSTAVIDRTPDGISITLPPRGFFKGSKGLGSFSIAWLAFIGLFGSISFGAMGRGQGMAQMWPFVGITALFGLIGLGLFYAALRAGRRRAIIDVAGGDLVITRQSVGRPKTRSWRRAEIERVVVGKSGMEVNDVPVLELQIWPVGGAKVGLFAERADDELRWLAAEIRAALGPGPSGPLPSEAGQMAATEEHP